MEYLEATGLEAVVGYLYLKGDMERVLYLVRTGAEKCGVELA
jgi:ribonuclease-3 family protein